MKRPISLFAFTALLGIAAGSRAADIDMVYQKSDGKSVGGEITKISRTEIVVHQQVGNRDVSVPANDIARVEWKNEPPTIGLARSNENSGNLSAAIAGYQETLSALPGGSSPIKVDLDFLLARTTARIAQADPEQLPTAIEKLKAFTNTHRDFFRFYEAQLLLAETALLANDYSTADEAFNMLEQAPWPDFQMAGKLGNARTLLAQNKVSDAKAIFDQVASNTPKNAAEKARQLEAMLGQANCMQRQSQFPQAIETLQKVIDQTAAEDTRLLAEAYLELGDCYAAEGQQLKQAVLAYLHVDVIPTLSRHSDLHAQALYNLAKLWPAVGQPGRGAEASAKLEQDYPNSEWTKKLSSG